MHRMHRIARIFHRIGAHCIIGAGVGPTDKMKEMVGILAGVRKRGMRETIEKSCSKPLLLFAGPLLLSLNRLRKKNIFNRDNG